MNAKKIAKVAGIAQGESIARTVTPAKVQLIWVNLNIPAYGVRTTKFFCNVAIRVEGNED